jgi:hypothetical protein
MRQPDRPEAGRFEPAARPDERRPDVDLAARLSRLPAAHPSADAGPSRDAPSPEPERQNWWEAGPGSSSVRVADRLAEPADWPARPGRAGKHEAYEPGERDDADPEDRAAEDATGDRAADGAKDARPDEDAGADDDTGPDHDADAGQGQQGGGRGGLGGHGRRFAGVPAAGRDPYRPWFAGSSDQPWFAASPDGLLGDQEAGRGPTPGG